jgi:hypothetical protein
MRGVSKQNTIKRARLKLIKIFTFQNKAFASKRHKMGDRRLAIKAKLKGSQMQNRAQEDLIGNIVSGANIIGPKAPRSYMLIEHRPSHLNYSAVLSFHNFILLRNVRDKKLLINVMLKAKLIKRCIFELSPIITVNDFQAVGMLIVQPQRQEPKVLKHFILTHQKENSRVTRVVINNDKDVPLASHVVNSRRTDSVHME